ASVQKFAPGREVLTTFLAYDDLFASAKPPSEDAVGAFLRLGFSWVTHRIGDLFHQARGLEDISAEVRWTAGMVVQWSEDAALRARLNARLAQQIGRDTPDVICAHSLGSEICYDTFLQHAELVDGKWFVAYGSQIGNPAV